MKIWGILLLTVLMTTIVLAEEYPEHQQLTDLQVSITSNNATSCVATTLQTPNSLEFLNITMQEVSNKNFNTTIIGGNFSEIGNYGVNIVCYDGGITYATGNVWRSVTPSGFTNNLGYYVLFFILSIGLIILGYYVEDAWIVILGSFALVLFGLYILYYGIDGLKDAVYTWGIGIIVLMLGAYFGVKGSLEKLDI